MNDCISFLNNRIHRRIKKRSAEPGEILLQRFLLLPNRPRRFADADDRRLLKEIQHVAEFLSGELRKPLEIKLISFKAENAGQHIGKSRLTAGIRDDAGNNFLEINDLSFAFRRDQRSLKILLIVNRRRNVGVIFKACFSLR